VHAAPDVTPEYFEILVLRELRKVGFEVGQPRVQRRSELPEPELGFVLELVVSLSGTGETRRALVLCRHQAGDLARDVIESAVARRSEASADCVVVFVTTHFAPEAVSAARERGGVALLQIVDGRSVFAGAGADMGGVPDHYPAWLPAHVAQLVDRDAAGQPRFRVLEAGKPQMILDAMRSGTDG